MRTALHSFSQLKDLINFTPKLGYQRFAENPNFLFLKIDTYLQVFSLYTVMLTWDLTIQIGLRSFYKSYYTCYKLYIKGKTHQKYCTKLIF